MSLESWSYVAGIVSAVVATLGFGGLIWYAFETYKLRKAAQEQVEEISKPCVFFKENPENLRSGYDAHPLILKNMGNGPAINVKWRRHGGEWRECPALEAGESRISELHIGDVVNEGALECVFESISRTGYMTQAGFSEINSKLDLRHTFKKLDHNP